MIPENHHRDWTPEAVQVVHKLRKANYKPAEIAPLVGRTESAINKLLCLEKKKGIIHHKLPHGNLKYDEPIVVEWRHLVKDGWKYKDIQDKYGAHPVLVSAKFREQLNG